MTDNPNEDYFISFFNSEEFKWDFYADINRNH